GASGVAAGLRQPEADFCGLAREELVRDLHQNAGAVAGARIGADRAAVLEVDQDRQRVLDDLVRLASLDIGNKSAAAEILSQRGIKQAETRRTHSRPRTPRRSRWPGGPASA